MHPPRTNPIWILVNRTLIAALVAFFAAPAFAQLDRGNQVDRGNSVVTANANTIPANANTVTVLKPNFSKKEMGVNASGLTAVELDRQLESIFRGGEPKNVKDLLSLEKQQSLVAEKIQKVTVHVEQGNAQGSGVVITPDGYILTAAHVAGKPNLDAWIRLPDGKRVRGKTMGMNRYMDAGLIKITETRTNKENVNGQSIDVVNPWPHATLGTSSQLRPGHWVVATGHPGGWNKDRPSVVRVGRILETMESTLITDCPLIGGDSGGPLFDLQGKLVGIHSRIGTEVQDNMHVPIDVFAESWDQMARSVAWGTLPGYKPRIGVSGSPTDSRAVVYEIVKDGPAQEAGIKVGDLIRKFDGVSVKSFNDLTRSVNQSMPGDKVSLEVDRDGKVLTLSVIVGVAE